MFRNITYYLIFGRPLIMYVGVLTLFSFLCTALIGFLSYKGVRKIPFKWHPIMATISITLAIVHGLMGILAYVK